MNYIRDLFLGQVYSDKYETLDDGGPLCASQSPFLMKFLLSFSSVFINLFILFYFSSPQLRRSLAPSFKIPSALEKSLGFTQILIFLLEIFYKASSHRLIFMLSPCHIATLLEGYLLIAQSTEFNTKLYICCFSWSTGAFMALIFPSTGLITIFGEVELFWLQHILTGIVCPLVLMHSQRYSTGFRFSSAVWLYANHWFSFYSRLVLFPISSLTYANINFQLCAPNDHPMYILFGDYYLLLVEIGFLIVTGLYGGMILVTWEVRKRVFFSGKKLE